MKTQTIHLLMLLVTVLCVLNTRSASAAPRVGSVLVVPDGDESVDLLLANAADALSALNIGVTEFEDATLAGFELAPALSCLSDPNAEDCSDVVNMVPAEWVLVLRIRRISEDPDSDQQLVAKLFSATTADLLNVQQRVCQRCSSAERMATVIRELVGEMARNQLDAKAKDTFLDVQSTPVGGVLRIDDVVVGPTGQAYRVTPGDHQIEIQLQGYRTAKQQVSVAANEHKALTVSLDANPKADGTKRMLGWASIGVGALALGTGVTFLALNEDAPPEGAPRQDSRRNTKGLGIAGVATGAAFVGLGAFLLLTTTSASDDQQSMPQALRWNAHPNQGGFSLDLVGRF